MFATLRNAIANMISTKKEVQCTMVLDSQAKNLTYGKMPAHHSPGILAWLLKQNLKKLRAIRIEN